MTTDHAKQVARYKRFLKLREGGATLAEIGAMHGISYQAVYMRLRKGMPKVSPTKHGILSLNGFGHLEGRDRARMLVRIRDNFTCRDCGSRRSPRQVKMYNARRNAQKPRMFFYDIHHEDGRCGKVSRGYDRTANLSGLITLCHKCHFNRPEHTQRKRKV